MLCCTNAILYLEPRNQYVWENEGVTPQILNVDTTSRYWSAWRSECLTPVASLFGSYWTEDWVGPIDDLDAETTQIVLFILLILNLFNDSFNLSDSIASDDH
jgi:hypothetical protein